MTRLLASPRASRPRVLFLCTGNACRSQMAEGWARHLHGEHIDVASAGILARGVDPRAVAVMAEAGVDISGQRSERIDELPDLDVDLVVTVCDNARDRCPVLPGAVRQLHQPFDDPPHLAQDAASEAAALAPYRRVRDEIRAFVEGLPDLLDATPGS